MEKQDIQFIKGGDFTDERGKLTFNNFVNLRAKRLYILENSTEVIRAWQGHRIESRWFTSLHGEFIIKIVKVDDWEKPSIHLDQKVYTLTSGTLDILFVPPGHATSIQSLTENGKLLVLSDFSLDEVEDNIKFKPDYWS